MKVRSLSGLAAAALLFAAPAAAVLFNQSQRVAADDDAQGRIVEISPSKDADLPAAKESEEAKETKLPDYWLGLGGAPIGDAVLRTQLQLADDVGVVVAHVAKGSPADKAGLREYDIVVAVNGEPISDITALQKVVADGGAKPIELKVIRLAKETAIKVTPEKRPADAPQSLPGARGNGPNFGGQFPQEVEQLFRQLQQGGLQGGRVFGDAMIGQPLDLRQMPNGLSVNVTREGDGPAKITVKKGDKTWNLQGDDEKALKALPDDVRPFVERMLRGTHVGMGGGGAGFNFGREWPKALPDNFGNLPGFDDSARGQRAAEIRKRTEAANERLLKRMEEMEQRLEKLRKEMEQSQPAGRTTEHDDASKT